MAFDLRDEYPKMRSDKAFLIECGPRPYGCAIPENTTPFIMSSIWEYQRECFDSIQNIDLTKANQ